jgi:hypothetical protein
VQVGASKFVSDNFKVFTLCTNVGLRHKSCRSKTVDIPGHCKRKLTVKLANLLQITPRVGIGPLCVNAAQQV